MKKQKVGAPFKDKGKCKFQNLFQKFMMCLGTRQNYPFSV